MFSDVLIKVVLIAFFVTAIGVLFLIMVNRFFNRECERYDFDGSVEKILDNVCPPEQRASKTGEFEVRQSKDKKM